MIIEQRPKLFTKKWWRWFNIVLWQYIFLELKHQEYELLSKIDRDVINTFGHKR